MVDVATDAPERALRSVARQIRAAVTGAGGRSSIGITGRFASLAYVFRIANAGIAFLTQIALARWMGAHEFGIYIYVWTWVILLGAVTTVGLASSSQRFVPAYTERGDLDRLRGFLVGGPWLAFALATATSVVALGVLLLGRAAVEPWLFVPLLLGVGCLPLFVLTEVNEGIARAYDWPTLALGPAYLVRPLLLLAFLAGLHLAGFEVGAVSALSAAVASTWVTALLQSLALARRLKRRVEPGGRLYAPGEWLRYSFPQFLVEGFYLLLTYCDVLILQRFVPPGDVAIYYAATKISSLVAFIFFSVAAAAAHRFTQFHVSGRHEDLAAFFRLMLKWTFLPSLAMAGVLVICGRPLLELFGEGFAAGYPALVILLVGLMARASVGPAEKLMTMLGQQSVCALVYALAFLANIGLNLLMVPHLGLTGAAVATSSALVLESILLFLLAKRRLGVHVFIWGGSAKPVS
jgi:O-antigen/teichoic acid export membrane protein